MIPEGLFSDPQDKRINKTGGWRLEAGGLNPNPSSESRILVIMNIMRTFKQTTFY